MKKISSSEITTESAYLSRRDFLKSIGIVSASAALLAACKSDIPLGGTPVLPTDEAITATSTKSDPVDELGSMANTFEEITNYNNYYEFTTDKAGVAKLSKDFPTSPWEVAVGGFVNKPQVFSMDDIRKFEIEDRIYRMRCVEAWSMVIPWTGFPLRKLLEQVEPTSDAKYVRFETIYDKKNMPGLKNTSYQWPYVEGLRLDEAMHDLTLLATGIYGKDLLPQNGAPVRLVVPWKYGFKSIKSIVKIDLVDVMPTSLWMAAAPHEYGFYANVNPNVNHPRWSQGSERRIGELGRTKTLMFNGYEDEVAYLYEGMDLKANY
jgi:sulfoxide reductase catalytic subunit YedY